MHPTTQLLPPIVSLLSLTPTPHFWWLLVGTIVDDSIVMSNSPQLFGRYTRHWDKTWVQSGTVPDPLGPCDFAGTRITIPTPGVLQLTNTKLIIDIAAIINRFPIPPGYPFNEPMPANGLHLLRESPSATNPLVPELVTTFRSLLGIILYVTGNTRPDARFATIAISQVANSLTNNGMLLLLQLGHYLVSTKELALTFRRPPPPHTSGKFIFHSDSSLFNDGGGGSWGGGTGFFRGGGGAFSTSVNKPRTLGDSTFAAELTQATHVLKEALAFRCISRELGFPPDGPTDIGMDSSAVILSNPKEKVPANTR
jgi:hypothetical protein